MPQTTFSCLRQLLAYMIPTRSANGTGFLPYAAIAASATNPATVPMAQPRSLAKDPASISASSLFVSVVILYYRLLIPSLTPALKSSQLFITFTAAPITTPATIVPTKPSPPSILDSSLLFISFILSMFVLRLWQLCIAERFRDIYLIHV